MEEKRKRGGKTRGTTGMALVPPAKAAKVLADYAKNNYNAKKTLLENGYAPTTADKQSGVIIKAAEKSMSQALGIPVDAKSGSVLGLLGWSVEDVVKEYKKVLLQDKDLTNKLKALGPALREVGVNLAPDAAQSQNNAPVSIVVKEVNVENTAQQSHGTTEERG